jgi:hypothetical protein
MRPKTITIENRLMMMDRNGMGKKAGGILRDYKWEIDQSIMSWARMGGGASASGDGNGGRSNDGDGNGGVA